MQHSRQPEVTVSFADLPGWAEDDHLAALAAFAATGPALRTSTAGDNANAAGTCPTALLDAIAAAEALPNPRTRAAARAFFEAHFIPSRIGLEPAGTTGLLTGYYEPAIAGARQPDARFRVPIYRRPADLVNLVHEVERGAAGARLTHARRTAFGLVPYPTRAAIEAGALAGHGLELLHLADSIDAYFLHVQGSGLIRLAEGGEMRITYDGKNGHPYTSIGRHLVAAGHIAPDEISMQSIRTWLEADPDRARATMQRNHSFVFFRELPPAESAGPLGVLSIPLVAGRSLAVDAGLHPIGTPIYVSALALTHPQPSMHATGFNRLMVAHDVGSAIRGPVRGDVFFGSGDEAARIAGRVKHPCQFFVLRPARNLARAAVSMP